MDIVPLIKINNNFDLEDKSQQVCLICHEVLNDREIKTEIENELAKK